LQDGGGGSTVHRSRAGGISAGNGAICLIAVCRMCCSAMVAAAKGRGKAVAWVYLLVRWLSTLSSRAFSGMLSA